VSELEAGFKPLKEITFYRGRLGFGRKGVKN